MYIFAVSPAFPAQSLAVEDEILAAERHIVLFVMIPYFIACILRFHFMFLLSYI
jgi:hypothetical protein